MAIFKKTSAGARKQRKYCLILDKQKKNKMTNYFKKKVVKGGGIMNREKEIKHLIYLKSELIKQTKKEIKKLQEEQNMIYGYKKLEKKNQHSHISHT